MAAVTPDVTSLFRALDPSAGIPHVSPASDPCSPIRRLLPAGPAPGSEPCHDEAVPNPLTVLGCRGDALRPYAKERPGGVRQLDGSQPRELLRWRSMFERAASLHRCRLRLVLGKSGVQADKLQLNVLPVGRGQGSSLLLRRNLQSDLLSELPGGLPAGC